MELLLMERDDFDKVYEIMSMSFPVNEMRTYDYLKKQLDDEKFNIYMNKEKTAFITLWKFDDFDYIEHFASLPQERGKGIGKEMIEKLIKMSGKTVVLEAEPAETEIQKRRIGFYNRVGFVVNDYYYFQPSMREGVDGLELKILSTPESLTEKEFEKIRDTIYKNVYKVNI